MASLIGGWRNRAPPAAALLILGVISGPVCCRAGDGQVPPGTSAYPRVSPATTLTTEY